VNIYTRYTSTFVGTFEREGRNNDRKVTQPFSLCNSRTLKEVECLTEKKTGTEGRHVTLLEVSSRLLPQSKQDLSFLLKGLPVH